VSEGERERERKKKETEKRDLVCVRTYMHACVRMCMCLCVHACVLALHACVTALVHARVREHKSASVYYSRVLNANIPS